MPGENRAPVVQQRLAINTGAAQIGRRDLIQGLAGGAAAARLAAILVVIVDDGETFPPLTLLLPATMILPLLAGTCLLLRLSWWRLRVGGLGLRV